MSTLYIEEYGSAGSAGLQCAPQPALATQAVSFTGTAGASAAFNPGTRLVRITANAACHRIFGTAPTATTSHPRLGEGVIEYFEVPASGTLKVSAVATA